MVVPPTNRCLVYLSNKQQLQEEFQQANKQTWLDKNKNKRVKRVKRRLFKLKLRTSTYFFYCAAMVQWWAQNIRKLSHRTLSVRTVIYFSQRTGWALYIMIGFIKITYAKIVLQAFTLGLKLLHFINWLLLEHSHHILSFPLFWEYFFLQFLQLLNMRVQAMCIVVVFVWIKPRNMMELWYPGVPGTGTLFTLDTGHLDTGWGQVEQKPGLSHNGMDRRN